MDKFTQYQTFCSVIETGSFVNAAAELGMSKAAVSRYVSELENHLRVRLLQRTTRRMSLTEEGELFYARCRSLLSEIDEAENEVSSRSQEVSGQLRVNVPVSFGIRYLARLWHGFHELYPGVRLDITLSDRVVDLVDDGYDLAIRIARLSSSSLVSRQLSSTRMVLCAAPGYLEKYGRPQQPLDLTRHKTISYSYWAEGNEWRFDGP
ncbi:MAG: LysR family transcriptional regulator, partial [Pseudomonadales bacterium]|nr:LysR family transcriptional regulator [Pseudomonadales bacterium]